MEGPRTRRGPSLSGRFERSGVEILEEPMSCQLDLLVTPFRGSEMAGDDAGPMDPTEIAEDEAVSRLGAVGGVNRQSQMPGRVPLPGVRREEAVLRRCIGLCLAPIAVEHVLARVDQALRVRDGSP